MWPRSLPKGMKFRISVDPSLVIITIYSVCLIYAMERDIFKRNNATL